MTQTALARQGNGQQLAAVTPINDRNSIAKLNMRELRELAEVFVASGAFSDIKQVAQAQVKIIAGQEFGFSPIVSMTGIHFFQGKVEFSSTLKASVIRSSGKYDYEITEHTDEACTAQFYRVSGDGTRTPIGVPVTYTMADAKTAGLTGKDNWTKHRKDMLFSAVIRQGMRRHCAELLHGTSSDVDVDVADERPEIVDRGSSTVDIDGEIVDTTTGEVIDVTDNDQPSTIHEQTPPPIQPETSTAAASNKDTAVELAKKLHDEHGIEFEALAMQFLPEGVAKFGSLTDEQAAEIVPGLQELLKAKLEASSQKAEGGTQ